MLPKKTLEVLESIKIFLGMEGFVYVLGLSHDIVSKLIDLQYRGSGVKGEQYIKKMIQIPITLPKWNNNDIVELVQDLLKRDLIDKKYRNVINDNIDLIAIAIENNPREIKRFLNNFIVAYEIFSIKQGFKPEELIIIQALQLRWPSFYSLVIRSTKQFRQELGKYLKIDDDFTRVKTLESDEIKEGENYDLRTRKLLRDFHKNLELWEFLKKNFDTLTNINDWNIYRRATEVGREPTKREDLNQIALDLLTNGNIEEFNDRRDTEFKILNLVGANLAKTNLKRANLRGANLRGANMAGTDLTWSNLARSDLSRADLSDANLIETKLPGAKLIVANIRWGDLSGADLSGANLVRATLIGTNLKGANLRNAIMINTTHENLKIDEYTQFENAIIDDAGWVDYINSNYHLNLEKIKNKLELKEKLKRKINDDKYIEYCLENSILD